MIATHNTQVVQNIRHLTENTFIIRFERKGIEFRAGQYLTVGFNDSPQHREYSIYSSENDNYIEILVREVLEGDVSLKLKSCYPGKYIEIDGPYGFLKISPDDIHSRKFIFIATGTGIAPFHSFVTSYPGLDYMLIHGVRYKKEAYEKEHYDKERYILCASKEKNGDFHGRVTTYIRDFNPNEQMVFYLCGNSSMIYEVYAILRDKGVSTKNIRSEVYF